MSHAHPGTHASLLRPLAVDLVHVTARALAPIPVAGVLAFGHHLARLRFAKPTGAVVGRVEVERGKGDEERANDVAEVCRNKGPARSSFNIISGASSRCG